MNNQFYESLKNNFLFKNTDITSLNLDQIKGRLVRTGEGEIIYHEGESSDFIYLIVAGQINIIKKRVLGKTKSLIFNVNEFFGNEEYFEDTKRTSTAIALQDCYIILLSREEVENLIFQDHEIYLVLRENLNELMEGGAPIEESLPDFAPVESFDIEIEKPAEVKKENLSEIEPDEPYIIPKKNTLNQDIDITDFQKMITMHETFLPKPELENNSALEEEDTKENKILNELSESIPVFRDLSTSLGNQDFEFVDEKNDFLHSTDEDAFFSAFAEPSHKENNNITIPAIEEKRAYDVTSEPNKHETEETDALQWEVTDDDPFIENDNFVLAEPNNPKDNLYNQSQNENFHQDDNANILPVDESGGEMNTQEVGAVIKAMELVNSTVKIDDLLTGIVNVATELTNAERGTLYLIDKEKGELWSKVLIGKELKEIRLKMGEGIAGEVARTKTTENIKDVNKHPKFNKEVDKATGYVTKTMLCFPLKNKEDEVIGVLQLLNSRKGEFTRHDEELLAMISINTAIALQNADLVEKLLQGERVSSLGKMTNFLIQDIKKPILVSKRYTEHLKSKNLSPEISQLVDMILSELSQVADLVQTTSSYAEGKTILRTTVGGINAAIKSFAAKIEQYVVSKKCKLVLELDKEINVKIDSKEFYQCFLHLVKNACEAMPDGGVVFVKTKIIDKTVLIFFEDSGLGIPESFIDKIFEPFMTHGKKEGAGLGLSITKKIIEAHQGRIEVKSSIGAGSKFIVTLPVST